MSGRHANISIFVPHIGCTYRCSFCNQYAITAQTGRPGPSQVAAAVRAAQKSPHYNPKTTELAFFGGSFTAIEPEYMQSLLAAAQQPLKNGEICGIRLSTRPDAVPESTLALLKRYGVTAIELGCQSLQNRVLQLNHRGHTAEDTVMAAKRVKDFGFELGLQMMTGLYGDTDEGALNTAQKIVALNPKTVRIYPTLVLKNTLLAKLLQSGAYQPQSLEQAVALTAQLLQLFEQNGITVIRTGLHAVENGSLLAGPWHPAFGELCAARVLRQKVLRLLQTQNIAPGNVTVTVPVGSLSKMLGQRKENIEFFRQMGYNVFVLEKQNSKILVAPGR